jgi:uncharacterized repeat protein (TIGR01451 family)
VKTLRYDILTKRLLLLVGCFFLTLQGMAQFTITENFKGSSVGSNIILGGDPSAYLTSGNADPVGDGWLRLTNDKTSQRGFAYINTSFTSNMGVYIEFEYKAWRNNRNPAADGLCVFLFDATTSPFRIGAYGGSLGYAASTLNNTNTPGLAGAYLGIGLDEYGNFASREEGKDAPPDGDGSGHNHYRPNAVTLRGPANAQIPYRYLISNYVGSSVGGNIAYNTKTSTRPTDSQFYRRVRIYVLPTTDGKYEIKVQWTTSPNGSFTQLVDYTTTDIPPAKLKLGFSASTGGYSDYHEIRNVLITTPGDVLVQKSVDKPNASQTDNLTYTVNVINNSTSAVSGLTLSDVIKDGNGNAITYGGAFSISQITFNNNGNSGNTATGFTSGTARPWTSNSLNATMNLAASSTATFTITGKLNAIPAGGKIVNSADITPPVIPGLNDDATNNHSEVSTTVYNPNLDLAITKGVDNNGAAKSSGNTFTIIVNNLSNTAKPADNTVTVTDAIPSGFTVKGTPGGTGWTTSHTGNTYTFTRNDALASLHSYDPITISVTPPVPTTAVHTWTNTATVAVTGMNDTNLSNNTASATLKWYNYWYGANGTDWGTPANWTANFVPDAGEDVEFATADNNGTNGYGNGKGTAINDLYLDNTDQSSSGGRIIGNLINASDKNLVITTGNQLKINGTVQDGNANAGTIVVKTDPANQTPNGTLIFTNPSSNQNVGATVEFYNKAYYCDECGLYKKQWQYFGIPVQSSSSFPTGTVTGNVTVNQWVEPFAGTNKWQTAPYTPDTQLTAFRGYEMTNDSHSLPAGVYSFPGTLYTGNATVPLTKTANVSYSGANLIGNSYTAAIPIATALSFSTAITDQSVYLFNTGTRDQWRKLDGSSVQFSGVAGGQYLAVPFYLAGQIPSGSSTALPSMIPATQSFMILADKATTLTIDYSKLVKNQTITDAGGNTIATRAATETQSSPEGSTSAAQLPSVVMDVIGDNSADRVWIFSKSGTSYGFDSGWDGRKLGDENSSQLYVTASDSSKLQVATVPSLDKVAVGFLPTEDGTYTLEFAVSGTSNALYLNDLIAGKRQQIVNGGSYTFTASKSEVKNRFTLSYAGESTAFSTDEALISVTPTSDGTIRIANGSDRSCSASLSDEKGRFIQRREVKAGGEESLEGLAKGTYIVRLQNAVVNDTRKVTIGK